MKVALWAEIRRLSEMEELSARAIAQKLKCSRRTVVAALALSQGWLIRMWTRFRPCWSSIRNYRPCGFTRRSLEAPTALPAARSACVATCEPFDRHQAGSIKRFITIPPKQCRSTGANVAACRSARHRARSRCLWLCSAIAE